MAKQKPSVSNPTFQIAQALEQMRSIESEMGNVIHEMQEKVRQLECLTEFSALLNSSLDTSSVREKALEATCQLLRCETASLFLVDASKSELYWETALGEAGKELQKTIRLPIDHSSIAGFVAATGEHLIVNDISKDPRHSKKVKQSKFNSRNMICVSLKTKGKNIGVLQALNKIETLPKKPTRYEWPEFTEEDLKLLLALGHQVAIAVENAQLYAQLKSGFLETVTALAEAIDKKDRYTGGHTKRVVHYSMCIAKQLNLTADELDQMRLGAILHDIGKIGIEDKILKKESPLDESEWPIMRTHPELGYQIMAKVEGLKDVVAGMRFHHERWDGKGYPLGLKGADIPLIARVISVADTYDAMVSTRPYRKGLPAETAYQEIVKNKGSQFCPSVVEAFEKAYKLDRMGKSRIAE